MRYLITGIGGFAAAHLTGLLLELGHDVFGLARVPWNSPARAALQGRFPRMADDAVEVGDVCDGATVAAAVARWQPDGIFHLAAQSSVGMGESDAGSTFAVNTVGTLQVLAAAGRAAARCRVLVVSSGECYGRAARSRPVPEDTPLRPVSIYAASKAAAEILVRQAIESHAVDAVCVRPFNHTGPGQSTRFVCSDFARQIVDGERRAHAAVRVGNLDAVRDFLDVRDVVRAYVRVWDVGETGTVYNISSAIGRKIGDVLADLCRVAGVEPAIESDPLRLRAADVPVLVGDNARIRRLGWAPEINWETTLAGLLAHWRQTRES